MAARKNYSFEKNQRARAKAAKREAKREQKLAKKQEDEGLGGAVTEDGDAPEASVDSTTGDSDTPAGGAD